MELGPYLPSLYFFDIFRSWVGTVRFIKIRARFEAAEVTHLCTRLAFRRPYEKMTRLS
jgi:hypothetical protein